MLAALSLLLMLAETPGQTTLPRQLAPQAAHAPPAEAGQSADPLFDRPLEATDDAAFMLIAVENIRQGVVDARAGAADLPTAELRAAAAKIGDQHQATLQELEALAKARGWRLPSVNRDRANTVRDSGASRAGANFIIHQIAYHESTVATYRAQAGGAGDAELKRTLRAALPGYQKNLEMLLGLKL
jgi:hypothetical protein